jgi:hypothetical protein
MFVFFFFLIFFFFLQGHTLGQGGFVGTGIAKLTPLHVAEFGASFHMFGNDLTDADKVV